MRKNDVVINIALATAFVGWIWVQKDSANADQLSNINRPLGIQVAQTSSKSEKASEVRAEAERKKKETLLFQAELFSKIALDEKTLDAIQTAEECIDEYEKYEKMHFNHNPKEFLATKQKLANLKEKLTKENDEVAVVMSDPKIIKNIRSYQTTQTNKKEASERSEEKSESSTVLSESSSSSSYEADTEESKNSQEVTSDDNLEDSSTESSVEESTEESSEEATVSGFNFNGYHFDVQWFEGTGQVPMYTKYIYRWTSIPTHYLVEKASDAGNVIKTLTVGQSVVVDGVSYLVQKRESGIPYVNGMDVLLGTPADLTIQTCDEGITESPITLWWLVKTQ